ncbi:MAG: AtpZ/AtpI family protein [Lachnospiraceae bacterium]|nr:AtpZ/AtpI family protein [Lachnospiraceae bacterium]
MPLLICTFLCYFLVSRQIVGAWVFIPGFILGLGASFMTAYKFYLYVQKKEGSSSSSKHRKGIYFNHHI